MPCNQPELSPDEENQQDRNRIFKFASNIIKKVR